MLICFDYRFVQREVDPLTLSAIEDKINKEKNKMQKMAAKATERQNSAQSNSQEIEPSGKTYSEIVKETSNTNISMETDSNSLSQSDVRSEVKGSPAEPMDIDDTKVVSSSSEPMGDKDTSSKRKREGSSDGGGQLSTSGGQLSTSGGQLSTSGGQTSAQGGIEVIPPGSNEDLPPALRGVSTIHFTFFRASINFFFFFFFFLLLRPEKIQHGCLL